MLYEGLLLRDDNTAASAPNIAVMTGTNEGHLCAGYEKLLKLGYSGIIKEAEYFQKKLEQDDPDFKEKFVFYDAVKIYYHAAKEFALRYSQLALEMAKEEKKSGSDRRGEPASWDLTHTPTWDLNVIGFRVDEAIPLIDKTIDRALVTGQTSLRIIHGFGTGRLRQAIRSHLRGVPFVKGCASADPKVGGGAITIVDLS